jgi:hypothetical protein
MDDLVIPGDTDGDDIKDMDDRCPQIPVDFFGPLDES